MQPPPIYDVLLCLALGGLCRIWMEDGSQDTATMHAGKWLNWKSRDIQPVRWQRLVPRWSTSAWAPALKVPGPIPESLGW